MYINLNRNDILKGERPLGRCSGNVKTGLFETQKLFHSYNFIIFVFAAVSFYRQNKIENHKKYASFVTFICSSLSFFLIFFILF